VRYPESLVAGARQREKPVVKLFSKEKRKPYEHDRKGQSTEEREREREREREKQRGWVSIRVPERSSQIRAEGVTY